MILSGGTGSRMQINVPKQYIEVEQKPIIFYTLNCFNFDDFEKIVIVVSDQWKHYVSDLIETNFESDKFLYALAGKSRQESILNGLISISQFANFDDLIVIHDAARPLLKKELVSLLIESCANYDGVMPVLPVKETIYKSKDKKFIAGLLNRDELFCGQTPEVFKFGKYLKINQNLTLSELADVRGSTEIAYKNNLDICLINGDEKNFKITTSADLEFFKQLIKGEYL